MTIRSFEGDNAFLSNFYPCLIEFEGATYPSVEHAYQASKFEDPALRAAIKAAPTAASAKRLGKSRGMKKNHGVNRIQIMTDLIRKKFQESELRSRLLETMNHELIEGNNWGDTFWGVCSGVGENHLGKILIQVRKELQDGTENRP